MAELREIIERDIPNGRRTLVESHTNLQKVADFCEGNYLQAEDKQAAASETKAYATHALASVAYHINTLATNFLSLLDLQATQLSEMGASINHLSQTVNIHKEKVARREIGVLTTNKSSIRPPGTKASGIIFPESPEKPAKFVRKAVDYSLLDGVGHGVTVRSQARDTRSATLHGSDKSSQGSSPYAAPSGIPGQGPLPGQPMAANGASYGTLGRAAAGHYHQAGYAAAPVNTPTVPSHYMSAAQLQQEQRQAHLQREREEREMRERMMEQERQRERIQLQQQQQQMQQMQRQSNPYGQGLLGAGVPLPPPAGGFPGMPVGAGLPPPPPPPPTLPGMGAAPQQQQHPLPQANGSGVPLMAMMNGGGMHPAPPHMNGGRMSVGGGSRPTSLSAVGGGPEDPGSPLPPPPPATPGYGIPQDEEVEGEGSVSSPPPPPPSGDRAEYEPLQFGPPGGHDSMLPPPPLGIHQHPGPGGALPPPASAWVPAQYMEKVIAVYDYDAVNEDELSFRENALIYVLQMNEDGWYEGVKEPGIRGLFPGNYVEPCM